MKTNRDKLIKKLSKIFEEKLTLIKNKNSDYASDEDSFNNFKLAEKILGSELHIKDVTLFSIYVRLLDKIARLGSFIKNEKFAVSTESVIDTCNDGSNYFDLIRCYYEEKYKK